MDAAPEKHPSILSRFALATLCVCLGQLRVHTYKEFAVTAAMGVWLSELAV